MSIAVIGVGAMGIAIVQGVKEAGWERLDLRLADASVERVEALLAEGHIAYTDPTIAAESAEVVLLAVKPQVMDGVLAELAPVITDRHLVVSIAAGITTATIEAALGDIPVVRCMPNTPALVGKGMTGLAPGTHATEAHLARAEELLAAVGQTVVVEEGQLDAVTGVSGSGPAYVFLLAEALEEAAIAEGLAPEHARLLAEQTVAGAGALLDSSPMTAEELRRQVTSPNGTTEAALRALENDGFRRVMRSAVRAATERSRELGA
jgi:pyrroline-5-carboxylate reductase